MRGIILLSIQVRRWLTETPFSLEYCCKSLVLDISAMMYSARILSRILAILKRIEMGRRSFSVCGGKTLGTGVICSRFQKVGYVCVSNMVLIMWVIGKAIN